MKFPAKFRMDFWLLAAALTALFLNGWQIWSETYANTYYTVAVASMMENFHNFFYASLDSAGSVTVDKPPVAFWIQTISAWIFGLHGWSVILPQTLAGVGSVILLSLLVKPSFGPLAARLAAFVMAGTPVAVAVSRTNNIDSLLVFTLLLASLLLFRAVRRGSFWSLLGAFAAIGVGFNMKMLQAYMVLPAFYLFYLLAAKYSWKKKLLSLAAATVVVAAVSVSWAVIVDSVPASERPFVGSSGTNSVLNLAFGYNGVARLTGDRSAGAADGSNQGPGGSADQADGFGGSNRPDGFPGGSGTGGGMFNTGEAGPLRLFQAELSGQASWLIPLGLIGAFAILASLRRRNFTARHREILFWLAWLIPVAGFFSIAGFFHHYYLIMLAPPVSALAGAAAAELWTAYSGGRGGLKPWLLPTAVLATSGFSWFILHPYDGTIGSFWSTAVLVLGAAAAVLLVWVQRGSRPRLRQTAFAAALAAMFIGPSYWALTPIVYGQNAQLPAAGPGGANTAFGGLAGGPPNSASGRGMPGDGNSASAGADRGSVPGGEDPAAGGTDPGSPAGVGSNGGSGGSGADAGIRAAVPGGINRSPGRTGDHEVQEADPNLLAYLREHQVGEAYLMAVTNYTTAAPYMIDEGESLVILNGFNASDEVYTPESLEALVRSGRVKYFLLGGGMDGGGRGGNSVLTDWIAANGTEIPSSEWQNEDRAEPGSSLSAAQNGSAANDTPKLYEVTLPEQ
ncbi:glycosyltransferase family 39 protein [Saccharibacillus qingshengii]|uniref:glycosyltransferase family 39 protein n=1 Tax=Saccharibacillus qingshengii TaxID=1763540 RepID=UPI001FE560DA|nr:glycosyltransferase family 39 protein [Saccharibacillus qingshengii]